jgi:Serine carboxypeptidase S28
MLASICLLTWLSTIGLHAGIVVATLPLPLPVDSTSDENHTLAQMLTIDMPVDHFNDHDTRTYKNRYWINDTYYQEGGPIFFHDFGEATVSEHEVLTRLGEIGTRMAPLRLAQRFNGMVILWEHRFYGQSLPFELDKSTGTALSGYDAYKYLNNEQALEDTVYFANNFSPPGYEDNGCFSPSQTPWIWVGGSYSGLRGAMLRVRNPDVFYATWASSAPVQAQIDMSVYFNPIQQSMPSNCSADVHAAITYVDDVLLHGTSDEVAILKRAILSAITAEEYSNLQSLDPGVADDSSYYSIANNLSYVFARPRYSFQNYNYDGSLSEFCDYLESWNPENATEFNLSTRGTEWLRNSADRHFTTSGIAASLGTDQAFYAFLSATTYKILDDLRSKIPHPPPMDWRSWTWQYCSEFGYFQISNASDPISMVSRFNNVSSYALNECKSVFPFAPDLPNVDAILQYGGWNMTPSNTMFTDGERDPWRTLGVLADKRINPSANVRDRTTDIPPCNIQPQRNKIFGQVYPGEVHTSDLFKKSADVMSGNVSPADIGFELFSDALEQWLECF